MKQEYVASKETDNCLLICVKKPHQFEMEEKGII